MAKAITFSSDFSSSTGWDASGSNVLITGGQAKAIPSSGYDYIASTSTYDLTGSQFSIKFVQNADVGTGTITSTFGVWSDLSGNGFNFDIGGGPSGTVNLYEKVAGVATVRSSFTYDPAVHVYLRLREASGTIYWETSTNGSTWTVNFSKTTTLTLTSSTVYISAGYYGTEPSPGFALFDDLNPGGGTPKMETLQDDFGTANTTLWTGYGGGVASVAGGQLNLLAATGGGYYPPLESVDKYTLVSSYAAIQLVQNFPSGTGTYTTLFECRVDASNYVGFTIEGGSAYVTMTEVVAGVASSTSVTFNPLRFKWFRVREASGTVYWETSIDGATWVIRRSKATTLNLSLVNARIVSGFYGTETNATALFDNFNVITGTAIGIDEPLSADLFTDDFATNDASKWFGSTNYDMVGGRLKLTQTDVNDYGYLHSFDHWDISESAFMLQYVQNAPAGNGTITTEFSAEYDNDNFFSFQIAGGPSGVIKLREQVANVNSDVSIVYNPDRHKWLRLRGSGGYIYWEASYNGVSWSILRSKTSVIDTSNVQAAFYWGHYDVESAPGYTLIDNFNLPDTTAADIIGWTVGTGGNLSFGALDGGTVQSKLFLEAADWLWEPIPDDPVIDSRSDAWCAQLQTGQHGVSVWDFADQIVTSDKILPDTPRYRFTWNGPILYPDFGFTGDPFEGRLVPVPMGTKVAGGGDGHLCVLDPVQQKVFSAWQAVYDAGTDTWSASWGGISELHGDGRDYIGGAVATNLARVAGVVLENELVAGEIPHAIFSASGSCGPTFRYPAQKSDGTNLAGVAYPVPEGVRIQLDPSIDLAAIPDITPGELAVGRAMQKYGAYLGDQGGGGAGFGCQLQYIWGPDYSGDYLETPPSYQQAGFLYDYFDMLHIPWAGNLRILANWDGGEGTPSPARYPSSSLFPGSTAYPGGG